MKEIMLPYIFIIWILVKTGVIKWTLRNAVIYVGIGAFLATSLFTASRFWAPVDLTDSSTVKAPQAVLSPLFGQKIDQIYVKHNQTVKQGDLLYTLEGNDVAEQIKSLEANLASLDHQISAIKVTIENDKKNLDRLRSLDEYASEQDMDALETRIQNNQADIQAKHAEKAATVAQISEANYNNTLNQIVAPFDGVVGVVNISEGSRLGNMHLYETSKKFIEMRVSDQAFGFIEKGQFAEFYVTAYPGHVFRGRVNSVTSGTGESTLSPAQGTQHVGQHVAQNAGSHGRTVIIEFEEPEGMVIPIGAKGSAWVSATKPHPILGFMDIIGGATVRLKSLKAYLSAL
ncbi:HlyD family secretion protein [Vibrio ulleungensis]|uniref:Efflux RND transporter periplasmic adaptor subunit n=1 Tax=Vibrio ulleungensis TaxID=2807619 RepID=A0ABS2HGV1_9VIBR|nr:efflux RND transporter periplasmic adaptor subunit [Vibrio ulleungensis]MBM7036770.1 efflux RND transporter periplasmic adaptor subunit [Vibrio ulleungensis]